MIKLFQVVFILTLLLSFGCRLSPQPEFEIESKSTGEKIVCEDYKENDPDSSKICNYFYSNGNLKRSGIFIDGEPYGKHSFYSENGNLTSVQEFNEMGSKDPAANQHWIFDKHGDTIFSLSNFIEISCPDTIAFQENFKAQVKLVAPHWNKRNSGLHLLVETYEDKFTYRRLYSGTYEIEYESNFNEGPGEHWFTGLVREFIIDTIKDSIVVQQKDIFFERVFWKLSE